MSFHLGKPVLVMLVVAAASGGALLLRPERPRQTDLVVWVFADSHARAYREGAATRLAEDAAAGERVLKVVDAAHFRRGDVVLLNDSVEEHMVEAVAGGRLTLAAPLARARARGDGLRGLSLIEQYQRKTGKTVSVKLISNRAQDVRLLSMFYNKSRSVPDLAEIEIGSIGKFFRPPASEVGFRPLNEFIEREGLREKLVAGRFSVWSKGDVIFGIPHDVHPVGIAYREDLWDEARVDPSTATTWDEFQERCLAFQAYWRSQGIKRWGLGLSTADADRMLVLLVQRGVNLIDNRNQVHMDDPKVLDTVARYALMVAGPRKIGADETPGGHLWARDLARGEVGALLASDWRVTDLKLAAPELSGKVAMMALPVWEEGDAPTATWGGTMMGIPRNCKDPEESWRLLKWLYFSDEARRAQKRYTDILPPVKEHWAEYMDDADPYFGGQKVRRLMAELAEEIPEAHVTPFRGWGKEALSVVLARAVDHVNAHGEAGLRENCRRWLDELAWELRRRIERGVVQ